MRYRTIVADPPWPLGVRPGWKWRDGRPSGDVRPLPYETMAVAEIAALPIRDLSIPDTRPAREGSTLFLWTTTEFLCAAHDVALTWGFRPSAVLVWCKAPRGFNVGGTFASNVEFCIYARRGAPKLLSSRAVSTRWFTWPRGAHSAKPDAFYDLVESISPGPRLEMFSRRARLGWDTWGNEALEHIQIGGTA